jgi:hypothetical protein
MVSSSGDEIVEVRIEPCGTGSRLYLAHTFQAGNGPPGIGTAGWSYSLDQLGYV